MTYGKDIGKKFYEDGSVRRYPGNTVVADVTPECSAYETMVKLHKMVEASGFDKTHLIMLPHDSYHVTVIRGLNDQVRVDGFWPEGLSRDIPMTEVDDYISAAVASVKMPENIRMRFDRVKFSASCMIALLYPADENEAKKLTEFRDKVADKIGLRLPKHETYRFHISLAYTRVLPEGEDEIRMQKLVDEMDKLLANQPAFDIAAPYMAYYNDMLAFSPVRLPRDDN